MRTEDRGNGIITGHKVEPLYGRTYLPKKFKIAFTVPGDNGVDLYINDIGCVVIMKPDGQTLDGFNIVVTPTSETAVGEFLGISVRDTTLGAEQDVYEEGDTVAVMTQGVIWVTAGASVTPADPVYWNPATSRYTKTTTHFPVPGAAFDTSGGNGDLVRLALR